MLKPIPKPIPDVSHSKAVGTIDESTMQIFVHQSALERILAFSAKDTRRESGGFLIGGLHEDKQVYVEVHNFLPAVDTRPRAASLTFTHETWAAMNRQVEERFPDQIVIGWHHTHLDIGVFLSGYDLFIHRNFFSAPWQIAMVVDPLKNEFEFYQWRNDQVIDCGFFYVAGGITGDKRS